MGTAGSGDVLTGIVGASPSETGLDAWFGKWPGDETDAQLSEALQSAS